MAVKTTLFKYSVGGGQFGLDLTGQFALDLAGQLQLDLGGHIDWIFQYGDRRKASNADYPI